MTSDASRPQRRGREDVHLSRHVQDVLPERFKVPLFWFCLNQTRTKEKRRTQKMMSTKRDNPKNPGFPYTRNPGRGFSKNPDFVDLKIYLCVNKKVKLQLGHF